MTQSKHTPGPWYRNIRANGKYPIIFSDRNQHVAQAVQQVNSEETEANIDLIAAAPELLEALEMIDREMVKGPITIGTAERVMQAIAKAKGQGHE